MDAWKGTSIETGLVTRVGRASQQKEHPAQRERGRSCRVPCARKNLGFYSKGRGSHEVRWAELGRADNGAL